MTELSINLISSNLTILKTNKIWLSSPHLSGSEQKYVQAAFDSNWIAPLGPNVDGFELDLTNYFNEPIFVLHSGAQV